ncbi:unnamed protein product [Heligmosomoides polygyrus]|uniref:Reverse transcriptase domain-containing protein n=1 Tax=Heligmosomoides polygyrus TaxID=6339 RepID=A0A183FD36_HELPZ|nr:unnamed protein product [Heligmosomoides polygyrus]
MKVLSVRIAIDHWSGHKRTSKTVVRTPHGIIKKMDITVGVHQESAMSPFLFAPTLDCLVNHLEEGPLRTILCADDIALVADSREELEEKVQFARSPRRQRPAAEREEDEVRQLSAMQRS